MIYVLIYSTLLRYRCRRIVRWLIARVCYRANDKRDGSVGIHADDHRVARGELCREA